MDHSKNKRQKARQSRVLRVRNKIRGTTEKPRLSVFKSNSHIYAQLIDDEKKMTLGAIGTQSKESQKEGHKKKSKESARFIGASIAAIALREKISTVVFDRGRYKYHGVIAEIAKAAREAGLQF